ncbi:hypothetical protein ACT2CV_04705 [Pasteurellaceae bacterium 22721_9_1]
MEAYTASIINERANSYVTALNHDGSIVGTFNTNPLDTIWSGANWANRADLPVAPNKNHNRNRTYIEALNKNGDIAAGSSYHPIGLYIGQQATIWIGNNWSFAINLEEGRKGESNTSFVSALSADGRVAAGSLRDEGSPVEWNRATIWYGKNWQDREILGSGQVFALNHNGDIAGGRSYDPQKTNMPKVEYSTAAIWSGEYWQTETLLPTPNSKPNSLVFALSADGRIAGGIFGTVSHLESGKEKNDKTGDYWKNDHQAILWVGDNWQTPVTLGTLRQDNRGESSVRALSADGSVAAGYAANEEWETSATLWSNVNTSKFNYYLERPEDYWQVKTNLGSLRPDKKGYSAAYTLSDDGTVVGGRAQAAKNGPTYATLWRVKYDNFSERVLSEVLTQEIADFGINGSGVTIELPIFDISTLKQPSTLPEEPTNGTTNPTNGANDPTTSVDNTTTPTTEPTIPQKTVEMGKGVTIELPIYDISKLKKAAEKNQSNSAVANNSPTSDTSKPKSPVEVLGAINLDFTINALQQFGTDSIKLMAMQQHALSRLQQGCHTNQTFCYDVRTDIAKSGETKDTAASFTAGYHFGNGLTLGVSFDRSLRRNLPDTYKRNSSNLGWGVFGRWQSENWYVQPAVAWDYYNAQVKRPVYDNTESEQHVSRIKGLGASLTIGQDFALDNAELGWYVSGRYNRISRTGYTEKNLLFPVKFGDLSLTDTTVALGTKLALPVTDKLKFLAKAEVEQRVGGKNPTYTAAGQYIGNFRYEGKLNKTRAKFSTGVSYAFSPAFKVEVSPYVERNTFGKTRYGGMLSFNGEF